MYLPDLLNRFVSLIFALMLLSATILAQDATGSTDRPGSEGSVMGFVLVVAWILTIASVVIWYKASGVKIFSSDSEFAYRPYEPTPTSQKSRVAARVKPSLDEDKQRNSVLSRLNNIVEKTREDVRPSPIFEFNSIPVPPDREPLPESNDIDLRAAVLDSCDEYQSDPQLRTKALDVLGGYRTGAAIDALSQAANYDVVPSVRAAALGVLASINHASVLEPLVIACADPAREVRAAASRALSKVTFSRADEWFRIATAADPFSARQCASALASAGMASATFQRLVNRNHDSVMEAFAITCALIRAGETTDMMDAIVHGSDARIGKALLHVIGLTNDVGAIRELALAMETFEISPDLRETAQHMIARLSQDKGLENYPDQVLPGIVRLDTVA